MLHENSALLQLSDDELLMELVSMFDMPTIPPLEQANVKSRWQFNRLIDQHGGTYSLKEASELLNVTPQTIRRRLRNHQLLGIKWGKQVRLPVWQFCGTEVVPGFKKILALLPLNDPIYSTSFILEPSSHLDGMTLIGALKRGGYGETIERYVKTVSL